MASKNIIANTLANTSTNLFENTSANIISDSTSEVSPSYMSLTSVTTGQNATDHIIIESKSYTRFEAECNSMMRRNWEPVSRIILKTDKFTREFRRLP